MKDLNTALELETASGAATGIAISLFVVLASIVLGPRYFRQPAARALFVTAVILRLALNILAYAQIINEPSADLVWFQIDAANIANGTYWIEPGIATPDNFRLFFAFFSYIFGPSFLLSDSICLIGFAISCVCFARLVQALGLARFESLCFAAFAFTPGSLLYLGYNAREVFQVLFLILMFHSILRYRNNHGVRNIVAAGVFGYLFAITHGKYLMIIPPFLLIAAFLPKLGGRKFNAAQFILNTPVAIAVTVGSSYLVGQQSLTEQLLDQGGLAFATDLTTRVIDLGARTQLPFLISSDASIEFVLMFPLLLGQFLFAPIVPFVISSPVDLMPAGDVIVRSIFLYGAIKLMRDKTAPSHLRDAALLFFVCYLLFCAISIPGTFNVGTLQRHQLKIHWLFFIVGAPVVARIFSAKAYRLWLRDLAASRRKRAESTR